MRARGRGGGQREREREREKEKKENVPSMICSSEESVPMTPLKNPEASPQKAGYVRIISLPYALEIRKRETSTYVRIRSRETQAYVSIRTHP
jgi:hypothetical protein